MSKIQTIEWYTIEEKMPEVGRLCLIHLPRLDRFLSKHLCYQSCLAIKNGWEMTNGLTVDRETEDRWCYIMEDDDGQCNSSPDS